MTEQLAIEFTDGRPFEAPALAIEPEIAGQLDLPTVPAVVERVPVYEATGYGHKSTAELRAEHARTRIAEIRAQLAVDFNGEQPLAEVVPMEAALVDATRVSQLHPTAEQRESAQQRGIPAARAAIADSIGELDQRTDEQKPRPLHVPYFTRRTDSDIRIGAMLSRASVEHASHLAAGRGRRQPRISTRDPLMDARIAAQGHANFDAPHEQPAVPTPEITQQPARPYSELSRAEARRLAADRHGYVPRTNSRGRTRYAAAQ